MMDKNLVTLLLMLRSFLLCSVTIRNISEMMKYPSRYKVGLVVNFSLLLCISIVYLIIL